MSPETMSAAVRMMEAASYFFAGLLLVTAVALSVRQRRVHPVLLICLGTLSLFWIESPFDWATYASFHPDLTRMPDIGPWPHTHGGLPMLAPVGYVMYFTLPSLLAVAASKRLVARRGWRRPQALLLCGFVVGTLWAIAFDHLSFWIGFYRFSHGLPGLTLFAGETYQEPLSPTIAMGVQVSLFAYLLGRVDAAGLSVLELWAARRTRSPRAAGALSIVAAVVLSHAVYLAVLAPHVVAKLNGWNTISAKQEQFPGHPNQPL